MAEEFQKTSKKSDRWFRFAIAFALLYGITFSLDSFFNWILFVASAYSFFMSYYLLPVQPTIFQGRPKQQNWRGAKQSGTGTATSQQAQIVRRVMFAIVGGFFALFFLFFVIGIVSSDPDDQSAQEYDAFGVDSDDEREERSAADYLSIGDSFFDNRQYDSADVYYQKALDLEPDNMRAVYGKGIVLWEYDRKDEAMAMFQQSYEGGNRFWWLSWVLADMYDKQNNPVMAISLYKEAIGMDSTSCEDCYVRLGVLEPENRQKYADLAAKYISN